MSSGRRITFALIGLVVLAAVGWLVNGATGSSAQPRPAAASATQLLSALPPEATATYRLILAGGPFPYPTHDGVVYENRSRTLPAQPSGYYHEYTVPTPGSRDRGARRLITGSARELYYTGDHYSSFVLVDPTR